MRSSNERILGAALGGAIGVILPLVALFVSASTALAQGSRAKPEVWMMPPGHEKGRALRELFEQPEGWKETRSLIHVLGYADHNLKKQFTDDELRAGFAKLNEWGIKLGLEVGAISSSNGNRQRPNDREPPE